MKKFICPNCSNAMSLDAEDGILTCISCGKSIPVTDSPHHEFGSTKNSRYIKQYAAKNKDMHTDGFISEDAEDFIQHKTDNANYYIPFELNADDISKLIYKNPFNKLLFTGAFNKIAKNKLFEKMFVPIWSNEVIVAASINAACTEYDGKVTNYYDVEKHAQLLFEQFNTSASTMQETLHIDSLFPYNLASAICSNEEAAGGKSDDGEYLPAADIPSDRYIDNIKAYADKSAHAKLNSLISSYSSAHNKVYEGDSHVTFSKLIYLPVWKIPYSAKGPSDYLYINGQTGKMSGKPPLGRLRVTFLFLIICLAIFSILILAAYFIGI